MSELPKNFTDTPQTESGSIAQRIARVLALYTALGLGCATNGHQSSVRVVPMVTLTDRRATAAQDTEAKVAEEEKVKEGTRILPERVETVLFDGNPEVGEIIFFRNLHGVTATNISSHIDRNYAYLGYQLRILEELERLKPKHIFYEGIIINEDYINLMDKKIKTAMLDLFIQSRNDIICNKKREFLRVYGGGFIYAILNQNEVDLHGVESKRSDPGTSLIQKAVLLEDEIKNIHKKGWAKGSSAEVRLKRLSSDLKKIWKTYDRNDEEREKKALEQIMIFLKENPGEKVVLIFGEGHNFCDDLQQVKNPPKVTSILYPRLLDASFVPFEASMKENGGYVCGKTD